METEILMGEPSCSKGIWEACWLALGRGEEASAAPFTERTQVEGRILL